MKRLVLICCAFALASVAASADLRRSDVLLTDSGVFYRVDSVAASAYNEAHPEAPVSTNSISILVLTIQSGGTTQTIPVPATLSGMVNLEPSLVFDPRDERIYVFWQRQPSPSSSELLLTSYKEGVWSNTTSFDNGIWRIRLNLRIGITHYRRDTDEDGNLIRVPATVAHAVWWEQNGDRESARYAMLELREGEVEGLTIRDMSELSTIEKTPEPSELPEEYDRNTLRVPFILDTPDNDSVDILFADWYTHHFEVVNVRPVLDEKNGVLHIPIGVTTGVMDAPVIRVRDMDAGLSAMVTSSTNGVRDILLYTVDGDAINFVVHRDGGWTVSREIVLGDSVPLGHAISALRRNLERN